MTREPDREQAVTAEALADQAPPIARRNIRLIERVWSAQRQNERNLYVHLPASYETGNRPYPVFYMHDGQNLFDEARSFAGEWRIGETMEWLGGLGIEAIIVGIENKGKERLTEYSPFSDEQRGGGEGDAYLDFVVQTVKPMIDRDFRTDPRREATGILGSSMGGLISLYGFFRYPEVFGFAGAMSPALWFAGHAIFRYVQAVPFVQGRIYLDVGTAEGQRPVANARQMRDLLLQKGYTTGETMLYVEDINARHSEWDWARRFPAAAGFLLPVSLRDGDWPGKPG